MPWQTSDGQAFGGSYESWIDRQIREAQERGEFDDLPGAGKPLDRPSRPDDPDWWIKERVAKENLDLSLGLPAPLRLRKEAEQLPDRIIDKPTEQAVRDLVEDFNLRVRESWAMTFDGPMRPAGLVDVDELIGHWRAHRPPPPHSPTAVSLTSPDRGWLRRLLRR